jgi:hypothetical protein
MKDKEPFELEEHYWAMYVESVKNILRMTQKNTSISESDESLITATLATLYEYCNDKDTIAVHNENIYQNVRL